MKTWFITGASRGFSALIMEAALATDAVVATARDPSSIADHPRLLKLPLDVTTEGQARGAVARGIERVGSIDVLVNNAGYGLLGAVAEATAIDVERVFATNVVGLFNVTRAVLPYMRSRRSGHVINMSSIGGYASSPGWGSTKFAVEGISEALSIELAPLGIHATAVEPGYFRTDFLSAQSLSGTAVRIDDYADTVGKMRAFAAATNHQQPGDPQRLAQVIVQLAAAQTADTSRARQRYGRAHRGEASRRGARARSLALGIPVDGLPARLSGCVTVSAGACTARTAEYIVTATRVL
jgi:NAD(P)-dependent dehydrogenase (short-subunit alcohol dehydrogenase family)